MLKRFNSSPDIQKGNQNWRKKGAEYLHRKQDCGKLILTWMYLRDYQHLSIKPHEITVKED